MVSSYIIWILCKLLTLWIQFISTEVKTINIYERHSIVLTHKAYFSAGNYEEKVKDTKKMLSLQTHASTWRTVMITIVPCVWGQLFKDPSLFNFHKYKFFNRKQEMQKCWSVKRNLQIWMENLNSNNLPLTVLLQFSNLISWFGEACIFTSMAMGNKSLLDYYGGVVLVNLLRTFMI